MKTMSNLDQTSPLPRGTINNVTAFDFMIECDTLKVLPSKDNKVEVYLDGELDKSLLKGKKIVGFVLLHTIKAIGHDITLKLPNERLANGYLSLDGNYNKIIVGDKDSKMTVDTLSIYPFCKAEIEINADCNSIDVSTEEGNVSFDGELPKAKVFLDEGNINLHMSIGDKTKLNYLCHTHKGNINIIFKDFNSFIADSSVEYYKDKSKAIACYTQERTSVDLFAATSEGKVSVSHECKSAH